MDSNLIFLGLNRIQILVNGKEILGTSIKSNLNTNKELIDFLEEIVRVLKAPEIPMKENEIL